MSPATAKRPTSLSHAFSDPESFGLFMEALRDLQTYADDSAQSVPDGAKLEDQLDSALDVLSRCYQEFPADLLPRYYLAITLTMKNQHLYAKTILEKTNRSGSQKASSVPDPPRHMVQDLLAARSWPLLDRAVSLFEEVIREGYDELKLAAQFNLAHVYAKRDTTGDLQKALNILHSVEPLRKPLAEESNASAFFEFVQRKLKKPHEATLRADQESVALNFQAKTLTATIEARIALEIGNEGNYRTATDRLEPVRTDVENTALLSPDTKHDLLADSWTKSGFIMFLHSIKHDGDEKELATAVYCLERAMEYKPFWIPAQTYLAMVYVGQGRLDEARQELLSVVGSTFSNSIKAQQTTKTS
jgi:hypothetical protein